MSAAQAEVGAALPFLDAVKDLLVGALGSQLLPGVAGYMDLFAEDGVLETPYVAPGSTTRLQGKPAIAGFLATLRGVIRLADFRLLAAYPSAKLPALRRPVEPTAAFFGCRAPP